jgi:hypothetical protein
LPLGTQEVRWFLEGALAKTGAGVEAWFERRPPLGAGGRVGALRWAPAPPGWRDDRYLLVPGAADMGIKWREGQLQIKGRHAALGARQFAEGIEGEVERWVKWSYAGRALRQRFKACFAPGSSGAPGAVLVEKRRIQRTIRLDLSGAAVEVPAGEPCARALSIELVRIRLAGRERHWTIGVEAFPGDAAMDAPFTAVVADFLSGCPALPLTSARSMSYPAWLARLDPQGGTAGHGSR